MQDGTENRISQLQLQFYHEKSADGPHESVSVTLGFVSDRFPKDELKIQPYLLLCVLFITTFKIYCIMTPKFGAS